MAAKEEKNAKKEQKQRTINLLQPTYAHRHKFDSLLPYYKPSKHYRWMLEPLLGAVVNIESADFAFISDIIDGKHCLRIELVDAEIKKTPASRHVDTPIHIPHIWTVVDDKWLERNMEEEPEKTVLQVRGFIYLYVRKGRKNIGIQAITATFK